MSQPPVEGNPQELAGGTESPTSSPSSNESQLLAEVKGLAARLDETDKFLKGLQKGTDKQIGQVKSDVKRILELKEQGLNEEQIKRELWIDEQIQGKNIAPDALVGKQEQPRPAFDIENSLKDLQFADNDVALAALKVAYKENPAELLRQAAKLRIQQLTQNPNNPANALPLQGGSSAESKTDLQKQFENESKGLRGNALIEKKMEFRRKGLDVN